MKFISKILGLGGLACCILLLPGGLSAQNQQDQTGSQAQQQAPSTADLESQPNVYRYPRAPRRRGFPQPANADPSANPGAAVIGVTPDNNPQPAPDVQPQPVQPAAATTAPAVANRPPRAAHASAAAQNFIQPGQGTIGPPAPLPPTLEQMAPNPPKIVYQNGLLSVDSVNSRLIDILNGIHARAGIQFEGIPALQDRVAGKFGPAPADEVLTSLLQGTHLDYVIIGTPENPSLVQRVILTPSSNSAAAGNAPGSPQPNQEANGDDEDSGDDAQAEEQAPTPQQVQPGVRPQGTPGPKTAEQLLQELRQMQQQNQQPQNQQQNQPPAPIKRIGPQ